MHAKPLKFARLFTTVISTVEAISFCLKKQQAPRPYPPERP